MKPPSSLPMLLALGIGLLFGTAAPVAGQSLRPHELNVQYHRAETAWRSGGSVLEAKARVDRVLRELPDDLEALKLRAEVLIAMQRPEEALEDARRAVEIDSSDGEAQLLLCEAARMSGDRALALQALNAAAERVIEDAALHIRLSWNAVELAQLDRAEAFARIALALKPDESAAYLQLARVFLLQNKQQEAAETVARGLRSSVIRIDALEQDSLVSRLIDHPAVAPLLNR